MSQEQAPISPAELQEIVRIFADSDLQELRLTVGGVDLLLSRNEHVEVSGGARRPPPPSAAPAAPLAAVEAAAPSAGQLSAPEPDVTSPGPPSDSHAALLEVRAPSVGTFYSRPAPDKAPFVKVGSEISAGDPVGTIEVMKMFTTVIAETAGTVVEICVEDANLVEHGQILMYVKASAT